MLHAYSIRAATCSEQGGLVQQVRKVCTTFAFRPPRQGLEIHAFRPQLPRMDLQRRHSLLQAGQPHEHDAVQAAGSNEGLVQAIVSIGGSDGHDQRSFPIAGVALNAIQLQEQLVQSLTILLVAAPRRRLPCRAHGVELVQKDDARRARPSVLEELADALGALADEDLHEGRGTRVQKRHPGLTGDRTREQCLARAARSGEQEASGRPGAEGVEAGGVAQEGDDLAQLLLGALHAGHIIEGQSGFLVSPCMCSVLKVLAGEHAVVAPQHIPEGRQGSNETPRIDEQGEPAVISLGGRHLPALEVEAAALPQLLKHSLVAARDQQRLRVRGTFIGLAL
mmetsp:Transcript_87947/g.223885  ORF Transcript_87947/g.223885 Transcript_87947/m.223885 type:complete len:337 (+) Transcript_87947:260-1270(+)